MKLSTFLPCFLPFVSTAQALINPILPGWNPDPSIIRVGSDYFIATSTFEYFPGHPIYHSTNLVDWKLIGHGLTRPSQLPLYGTPADAAIWAPTLRFHNGTFYLATTARYAYTPEYRLFPRSFCVTTTDIFSNNWSEPIFVDSLGFDPDLFFDSNGDAYVSWAGINNAVELIYGIYQNKIDIKTGTSLTPAQLLSSGILPSNAAARPEGPHVYLINGTYYLIMAEGGTSLGHRVTVQRSTTSPAGPWEANPKNPILFNGADLTLPVQQTGHADIVEGPDGNWWGVALAARMQGGSTSRRQLGRETFLFPVTWEDGWPVFNGAKPLTERLEGVLTDKSPTSPYLNEFTDSKLDETFYSIRTPQKTFHTLTARPGFLRINGNSFALGDRDTPALLIRKQTSPGEIFETVLEFKPSNNLTEAGISIYYSDFLHNEIGITGSVDGTSRSIITRTITVASQVGPWPLGYNNNTIIKVAYTPLTTTSDPVKLTIFGNSTTYTLGFAEGDNPIQNTTTFDSSNLSRAPAGASFFKGAAFGIYNTGTGKPTLDPADFGYWKQTPA